MLSRALLIQHVAFADSDLTELQSSVPCVFAMTCSKAAHPTRTIARAKFAQQRVRQEQFQAITM